MRYLPIGEQMKKADFKTIDRIGLSSMVLMERAALQVVRVLKEEQLDLSKVLVVCGSGNNGGDGYAVARLLHLEGYEVHIQFVGSEESRSDDNSKQNQICSYYGIPTVHSCDYDEYSVIIDAIFGIGLKRNIAGTYYTIIQAMNQAKGAKVSIDIPSGLSDKSGTVLGICVEADITVAIAFAKRGVYLNDGNRYCGNIRTVDIGITAESLPQDEYLTFTYGLEDLKNNYPKRIVNSHKGNYGKVLFIAGSKGMAGAAFLCAKSAYMTGCGLVQIYTAEENLQVIQTLLPEAIVKTYRTYDEETLINLLEWADTVGIGCGLGTDEVAEKLVKYTLQHAKCPCVLDADALNILSKHMELLMYTNQPIVLTPHMKEMSRLLGCTIEELRTDRFLRLIKFVESNAVTCVLKDARTLVAERNKDIYMNLSGNHAMAKGGSGDVLTGIISGIAAQGIDLAEAARLGVYLHGLAGDVAKTKKGAYSVLASDIIESISDVLKEI